MTKKTVYVIGAGASKEVGLPTGEELKSIIARMLDIKFDGWTQISGDGDIAQALRHHSKVSDGASGDMNPYRHEAIHISEAMPQAISIDNFIDSQRGNEKLELCGKLAIVRAILQAESRSQLQVSHESNSLKFSNIGTAWYIPFFQLLTENCQLTDLPKRFQKLAMVIFNYDRCLEHFLFCALQNYYRISREEAANLVKMIPIYHPYGKVGNLRWENGSDYVEFGDTPIPSRLLELTRNIRTFTEGSDPEFAPVQHIHDLVNDSERFVFLGFAFHPLNMALMQPTTERNSGSASISSFSTAHGVSDSDCKINAGQIDKLVGKRVSNNIAKVKCSEFFKEYWRSLSFAQ